MTTLTEELDNIFNTLNGSSAHACYCQRSTDGGCKCALKDEYLAVAKQALATTLRGLQMPEKYKAYVGIADWQIAHNKAIDQCQAVLDALIANLEAV